MLDTDGKQRPSSLALSAKANMTSVSADVSSSIDQTMVINLMLMKSLTYLDTMKLAATVSRFSAVLG